VEQDTDDKMTNKLVAVTNFSARIFFSEFLKEGFVLDVADDFQQLNEVLQLKNVAGKFVTLDVNIEKYFDAVSTFLLLHCFAIHSRKMDNELIRSIYVESLQLSQAMDVQQQLIKIGKANTGLNQSEKMVMIRPIVRKIQRKILEKYEMKSLEDFVNFRYELERWMHCYGAHDREINELTNKYHENMFQWIAGVGQTYSQRRWVYALGILTIVLGGFGFFIVSKKK
jgi:hypothetical protein